jgi:hypothetical protein
MDIQTKTLMMLNAVSAFFGDARERAADERGDVPGWVMITLMSAALVAALIAIAGPALSTMFSQAIQQVNDAAR